MNSRAFHNIITIGTLDSFSADGKYACVKIGDIKTKPLPLPAFYGRNFIGHLQAHPAAQVVLNSPSGDLDTAVIVGFLWSNTVPPYTADENVDGIKFNDGTLVEYNSQSQALKVKCVGNVTIEADGTLKLKSPSIEIDGPVTQTGGDMTSDGISAQTHKHTETGTKTQVPE